DLAHEVVTQALLAHPLEGLDRWPVAAQADLDEVPALDRTGLDEPPHRRAVTGQVAPVVRGGVRMSIEMDDPDAARPADLGDRGRTRPGDGMVAPEHDRDRAAAGHLEDLAVDERMGPID